MDAAAKGSKFIQVFVHRRQQPGALATWR